MRGTELALAATSLLWESSGSSHARTQTGAVKTPTRPAPSSLGPGLGQLGEVGLLRGG